MRSELLLVVATLFLITPLLAADVHANTPAKAAAKRRYINLPGKNPSLPFSDAVIVGDTMYLSGRIGIDPKTGQAPADIDQEIKLLLDGVKAVLAEGGMTMDDLVSVQIFCPDLSLFDKFNAAYRTYFKGELPARAFIGSGPILRGGHFEVVGVARKQ
jgi:2-iminobutanoate/2-iminopropanoate deaminase